MNSLSTGIRESLEVALSTIERRFDWSHCQKQAILSGDKATTVLQSFIHLFFQVPCGSLCDPVSCNGIPRTRHTACDLCRYCGKPLPR